MTTQKTAVLTWQCRIHTILIATSILTEDIKGGCTYLQMSMVLRPRSCDVPGIK